MPKNQQQKRRRKRYQLGSAYAGDVKPTGIFSIFSHVKAFFVVGVVIMLGSLGVGGFIGSGLFGGGGGGAHSGGGSSFVDDGGSGSTSVVVDPEDPVEEDDRFVNPPSLTLEAGKEYLATIKTEQGDIQVLLFADQVPTTVNNFVFLAQEGFYDGLSFNFVAAGFSAQAGDVSASGRSGPLYDLEQEAPGEFERGVIGMADASQFFVALTESEQFEEFTPFGEIVNEGGLDVADSLAAGTRIESIEILVQ